MLLAIDTESIGRSTIGLIGFEGYLLELLAA
jgi:hypothetical protein